MKQSLIAWLFKLLERDFPVRAFYSTRLGRRVRLVIQVVASCALGIVLVAFVLTLVTGRLDEFLFVALLLVAGVIGIAVATFVVLMIMQVVGNLVQGVKTKFFRVEARGRMELDHDLNEAAALCRDALEKLPQGYELRSDQSAPSEIVAKTSMSWKSAGEIVSIRLVAHEGGGTGVEIYSAPWLQTTMFDGGINARNVEIIASHLRTAGAPRSAG